MITLGSLFSGIGGFEYAAQMYGIKPIWASEIEPNCIKITSTHFPDMQHCGSIIHMSGNTLPPVDVICGGSPCQNLSVAGQQAGINLICPKCGKIESPYSNVTICSECGNTMSLTESGLFLHQIRIIKEMREKTNACYPKVVIWENVIGSLSSNKGEDFYCVLKEFCGLMGERLPSTRFKKWSSAGEILADHSSLAWRSFNAQYWGTPQHRCRVFLVVDFTGQSARDILFKSERLRQYTAQIEKPWEAYTRPASTSTTIYRIGSYYSNSMKSSNPNSGIYEADIAPTIDTSGGNPMCNQGGIVIISNNKARRLTPLECERLQGFPDNWTVGVSDTARYRALGNSQQPYIFVLRWQIHILVLHHTA